MADLASIYSGITGYQYSVLGHSAQAARYDGTSTIVDPWGNPILRNWTSATPPSMVAGRDQINTLFSGASAMTVVFWVYFRATPTADNYLVYAHRNGAFPAGVGIIATSSGFNARHGVTGSTQTSTALAHTWAINTWYCVAYRCNFATGAIGIRVNKSAGATGSTTFGATTYSSTGATPRAIVLNTNDNSGTAGTQFNGCDGIVGWPAWFNTVLSDADADAIADATSVFPHATGEKKDAYDAGVSANTVALNSGGVTTISLSSM